MFRIKTLYISLILLLFCQSCQNTDISYSEKIDLSFEGWTQDHHLVFDDLNVADNEELSIRITHSNNYKFENIYLKVEAFQDTSLVYTDIFSIPLTNDQGQWLGASKGDSRLAEMALAESLRTLKTSRILVSQYSREPVLKGIEQIELLVQKP